MNRRILVVGENPSLRRELQYPLNAAEDTWLPEFARTGAEAIARIVGSEFDAVFTTARLPDVGGLQLLDEVGRRQPRALRIIQSDMQDSESTLKCVGTVHHHIAGPCNADILGKLLHQAMTMESWLPSAAIQNLLAQMQRVPSSPSLYFQINEQLQSPTASVENVADLIARDPAITAKLLQLANSAAFGLQLSVSNPVEAVSYLGLETTQSLVLLAHTFSDFDQQKLGGFSIDALWQHSVWTGHFSRRIALVEKCDPDVVAQAFVSGLLHDIGKLLFAANLPEGFKAALEMSREQGRSLWEVEAQVFGGNHAEVAGCLLGIWGLPAPIVDAVAYHHFPIRLLTQPFGPITATFAANIFEHSLRQGEPISSELELDPDQLKKLGLGERVQDWQQSCLAES